MPSHVFFIGIKIDVKTNLANQRRKFLHEGPKQKKRFSSPPHKVVDDNNITKLYHFITFVWTGLFDIINYVGTTSPVKAMFK